MRFVNANLCAKGLQFRVVSDTIKPSRKTKGFNHSNHHHKEDFTMAYTITDACISCGACAAGCPVEAIAEGDGKYEINAETCIECGACADTCPVGAPVQE